MIGRFNVDEVWIELSVRGKLISRNVAWWIEEDQVKQMAKKGLRF